MIVVTAPTSNIGRQVVERLIEASQPIRVIARDPSRLSPQLHERVEVVQGSHGDAEAVNMAFAGADAVFWLVPPNPTAQSVRAAYLDFTKPACDAFQRHKVKRVVGDGSGVKFPPKYRIAPPPRGRKRRSRRSQFRVASRNNSAIAARCRVLW
jgi:nucleoside-diphosphate-sugar epimerase